MAYKILKTDAFQRDLDAVIGYIVLSLKNRIAAVSLLDDIEKSYRDLEYMPLMYEACYDPCLKELGYRKVKIRNYIMIYKVNEDEKIVYIIRLFHGKQNYEKLI